MSDDPIDLHGGDPADAAGLRRLASRADAAARRVQVESVADLFRPGDARIDDRRRAAIRALVRNIVTTIGSDLIEAGAERLIQQGAAASARALDAVEAPGVLASVEALLASDPTTTGDLIGRVTLDLIGEALPDGLVEEGAARPSAFAVDALLAAESRRRAPPGELSDMLDLSAESAAQFVWWIAAAIAHSAGRDEPSILDALVHAARRSLARHDEGDRLEAIAARVALRANLRGDALGPAVDHCLKERRIVLLTALIAQAAGVDYAEMRAIVAAPYDARLWLILRMIALPDAQLARVGYALAEADPRRDLDAFADGFPAIRAIGPDAARDALIPLRLPVAMRRALEGIG